MVSENPKDTSLKTLPSSSTSYQSMFGPQSSSCSFSKWKTVVIFVTAKNDKCMMDVSCGFWWFCEEPSITYDPSHLETLAEISWELSYFLSTLCFNPDIILGMVLMSFNGCLIDSLNGKFMAHHPLCVWIVAKATYLWDISRWGSKNQQPHASWTLVVLRGPCVKRRIWRTLNNSLARKQRRKRPGIPWWGSWLYLIAIEIGDILTYWDMILWWR